MRIVVTRPEGQERDLVSRLEGLGHEVDHCPLIAIEPLGDEPIDVAGYDWVVVTSANGARELLRRARGEMPRLAAIGPATAEALGGADLVPAVATQEGPARRAPASCRPVLFAAGEGARTVLPEALGADVVFLYRTRELRPRSSRRRPRRADLAFRRARAAALGTGSAVVSIGPETTRAARAAGIDVVAEAEEHSSAGLADAVAGLSSRRSSA